MQENKNQKVIQNSELPKGAKQRKRFSSLREENDM
jgi:hypothetical protein